MTNQSARYLRGTQVERVEHSDSAGVTTHASVENRERRDADTGGVSVPALRLRLKALHAYVMEDLRHARRREDTRLRTLAEQVDWAIDQILRIDLGGAS